MLPPTVAAADLGPETLLNLLRHDDPVGVVSIFADAAPGGRGVEIDVRNRLTELGRRVRDDEPTLAALGRVEPELSALLDPAGAGRGRALFVPLSGGEPTRVVTQLRVANRVVLDERPFVHPLLECVERGRPAGVVLLSSERAELLEWVQGQVLVFAHLALEDDELRARPGPLDAREQHQRRARERRRRFVEDVASTAADLAERRGWDRLLVSGGGPAARPLLRALPKPLREHAIREPRHLIDLDWPAVERAVGKRLEEHQAEQDERLVETIRDAAQAGHGAALGLSEVAAALNDARVDHLVYDSAVRHTGALTSSGRIIIPPERDPAGEPLVREPRLTERMVERCLTTGARVTPVEGAPAALLADTGGVAARLRW